MIDRINKFISGETTLDEISVSELEALIADFPFADTFKVLLAKKMNSGLSHSLALQSNDNVQATLQNLGEMAPKGEDSYQFTENAHQEEESDELTEIDANEYQETMVENIVEDADSFTQLDLKENQMLAPSEIVKEVDDKIIDDNLIKSTDDTIQILVESDNSEDESFNIDDEKPKKKHKKTKKNKADKFGLKEYSGISDFSKWLLAFKEEDVEKKIKKEEKAARKRIIEENARKSVTKSAVIISESLAVILASQGHLDDAKKMYEQLMHKYPEKSSYFAGKINNLIKI